MPEKSMSSQLKTAAPFQRRRNDILLLAGILVLLGVFALIFFTGRKTGAYAALYQNGQEIARYTLSEDREVPVKSGDAVTNVLVIKNGEAFISQAQCPDQICVHHRPISKVGETVVCLPHKVVIKVLGKETSSGPDTVV